MCEWLCLHLDILTNALMKFRGLLVLPVRADTCAHARYVMYLFVGGVMMTSRRKRTAEKTQTGVWERDATKRVIFSYKIFIRFSLALVSGVDQMIVSVLLLGLLASGESALHTTSGHCEKANNTRTLWLWRFISGNRCKCHLCAFVSITWPKLLTQRTLFYTNVQTLKDW